MVAMIKPPQTFGDIVADALMAAKAKVTAEGGSLYRSDLKRIVDELDLARLAGPQISQNSTLRGSEASDLIEYTPERFEALRVRICGWAQFNRRVTTKWTDKELKALRKVFPYHATDIVTLQAWYNADATERTYCRKDIQTLLNNWPSEVDRARTHLPSTEPVKAKDYSRI